MWKRDFVRFAMVLSMALVCVPATAGVLVSDLQSEVDSAHAELQRLRDAVADQVARSEAEYDYFVQFDFGLEHEFSPIVDLLHHEGQILDRAAGFLPIAQEELGRFTAAMVGEADAEEFRIGLNRVVLRDLRDVDEAIFGFEGLNEMFLAHRANAERVVTTNGEAAADLFAVVTALEDEALGYESELRRIFPTVLAERDRQLATFGLDSEFEQMHRSLLRAVGEIEFVLDDLAFIGGEISRHSQNPLDKVYEPNLSNIYRELESDDPKNSDVPPVLLGYVSDYVDYARTEFGTSPATVPEPSSMAIFACIAITGVFRTRRRAA